MERRILLAGSLFSLAVMLLVMAGCTKVVEKAAKEMAPRVTAINVSLTEVTLTDATIEVKTVMENANPVAAVLSDLHFDLFYWTGSQWNLLAQGKLGTAQVQANGSWEIAIPTTAKHRDAIAAVAWFLANQGSLRLKLEGSAHAKVGPMDFTVPFGQQFTFSLGLGVKPPSLPGLQRP